LFEFTTFCGRVEQSRPTLGGGFGWEVWVGGLGGTLDHITLGGKLRWEMVSALV